MAVNDLLSQDEIDALLHGVSSNDADAEDSELPVDEARAYDFTTQDRIIRGRMPALELINERYAQLFRESIYKLLRKEAEISANSSQMLKFSEYVHSLFVPTSLNLVRIKPLPGNALFVFDPKLVFMVVENYFGGEGRFGSQIEDREFTPTENRIIEKMLNQAFLDLEEAWAPVLPVSFELVNSESNPQFINNINPNEIVVINSFHVEIDGIGGDFHVTFPYSMLEPIKDNMDSNIQGDGKCIDGRWENALFNEIKTVHVGVSCTLAEITLSLKDIMNLKKGDILPIEIPGLVTLNAENIPVFRGVYGESRGNKAVKVKEKVTLSGDKIITDIRPGDGS